MRIYLTIAALITLSTVIYAEQHSSIDSSGGNSPSVKNTVHYNAKDFSLREDQVSLLNSELDRLANLISDLSEYDDYVFENEIGHAPIQQLENDDINNDDDDDDDSDKKNEKDKENGDSKSKIDDVFDFDSSKKGDVYVEFSLGGKHDPLDDELNSLEKILNTVTLSVEGLLNAILNPILGDRATGRPGVLTNLLDKLSGIVNNLDTILDPSEPRRPRRSRSREDSYENEDLLELDSANRLLL